MMRFLERHRDAVVTAAEREQYQDVEDEVGQEVRRTR